jgi:hypothetical protein
MPSSNQVGDVLARVEGADRAPGFWPNYREPTPLARAIQYPLADPNWQNRVLNAYALLRALANQETDTEKTEGTR